MNIPAAPGGKLDYLTLRSAITEGTERDGATEEITEGTEKDGATEEICNVSIAMLN